MPTKPSEGAPTPHEPDSSAVAERDLENRVAALQHAMSAAGASADVIERALLELRLAFAQERPMVADMPEQPELDELEPAQQRITRAAADIQQHEPRAGESLAELVANVDVSSLPPNAVDEDGNVSRIPIPPKPAGWTPNVDAAGNKIVAQAQALPEYAQDDDLPTDGVELMGRFEPASNPDLDAWYAGAPVPQRRTRHLPSMRRLRQWCRTVRPVARARERRDAGARRGDSGDSSDGLADSDSESDLARPGRALRRARIAGRRP